VAAQKAQCREPITGDELPFGGGSMNDRRVQWILWLMTMVLFTWLTLTANWDWLSVSIVASAILWYGIVPPARSRQQ
jgi:hypothetical protein